MQCFAQAYKSLKHLSCVFSVILVLCFQTKYCSSCQNDALRENPMLYLLPQKYETLQRAEEGGKKCFKSLLLTVFCRINRACKNDNLKAQVSP